MTWEILLQLGSLVAVISSVTFGVIGFSKGNAERLKASQERISAERTANEVSLALQAGKLDAIEKTLQTISSGTERTANSMQETHLDIVRLRNDVQTVQGGLDNLKKTVDKHDTAIQHLEIAVAAGK